MSQTRFHPPLSVWRCAASCLALGLLLLAGSGVHADEFDMDDELLNAELDKGQALILVTIENKNGQPMEGVIVSVRKNRVPQTTSYVSNTRGKIVLTVPINAVYTLSFLSLDSSVKSHEERFEIDRREDQRHSLIMTYDPPTTRTFILKGVSFETGKAILAKASFARLRPLLEYLTLKPDIGIELSGHTDNVGDDDANLRLSDERANAVKSWLVSNGVAAERIFAVGYGAERPLADNSTAAGRSQNRRTEVRIID